MRGAIYFAAAALTAGAAFWTYRINYQAQAAVERLTALRGAIAAEREAIAVLRAEIAFLSAPDRLRALVAAHDAALGLAPLAGTAFTPFESLPFPPPESFWAQVDPALLGLPPGSGAVALRP